MEVVHETLTLDERPGIDELEAFIRSDKLPFRAVQPVKPGLNALVVLGHGFMSRLEGQGEATLL